MILVTTNDNRCAECASLYVLHNLFSLIYNLDTKIVSAKDYQ